MLWWESLSTLGRIFACIAVPFTVVMLIQTVMLLFGFSGDHGTDGASLDHDISHGGGMDHDFSHGGHIDMGHGMDHGDATAGHDFAHGHAGTDAHSGGHHNLTHGENADLRLFTVRGVISFMVVLGWIGLILDGVLPDGLAILISVIAGFGALYLTAKIFQWSKKLQSSGNIRMENAVGAEAQVYLTIPASGKGSGKVHVMVQQRLTECDAVTNSDKPLPTGSQVTVTGIHADDTLIVEPKI